MVHGNRGHGSNLDRTSEERDSATILGGGWGAAPNAKTQGRNLALADGLRSEFGVEPRQPPAVLIVSRFE